MVFFCHTDTRILPPSIAHRIAWAIIIFLVFNQKSISQPNHDFAALQKAMIAQDYSLAHASATTLFKTNYLKNKDFLQTVIELYDQLISTNSSSASLQIDTLFKLIEIENAVYGTHPEVLNKKGYYYWKYRGSTALNSACALLPTYKEIFFKLRENTSPENRHHLAESACECAEKVGTDEKNKILDTLWAITEKKIAPNIIEAEKELQHYLRKAVFICLTANCDRVQRYFKPLLHPPYSVPEIKKAHSLFQSYECTQSSLYLSFSEIIVRAEPSYNGLWQLGNNYLATKNYQAALQVFFKADSMATLPTLKADCILSIAKILHMQGDNAKAYQFAEKAAKLDSENKDTFVFLGDLCIIAAKTCPFKSAFSQKTAYIAAGEWYKAGAKPEKAKDVEKQYPTEEEIKKEGLQPGQNYFIACFLNQNIQLVAKK